MVVYTKIHSKMRHLLKNEAFFTGLENFASAFTSRMQVWKYTMLLHQIELLPINHQYFSFIFNSSILANEMRTVNRGMFFFHYNRPSGIYIVHTTHINWIMSVNLVMANEMNISNSLPNISSGLILQNQMHATTFQCPFSEEFFNLHSVNCK